MAGRCCWSRVIVAHGQGESPGVNTSSTAAPPLRPRLLVCARSQDPRAWQRQRGRQQLLGTAFQGLEQVGNGRGRWALPSAGPTT